MSKTSLIKSVWIATVLLYSLARTLLIWSIFEKYGVNQYIYLIIDLISSFFYAFFSTKLVVELSHMHYRKIFNYLIPALIFNFIPDVYILLTADQVPKFVLHSFIEVVLALAALAGFALYKEVRKRLASSSS